MLSFTSLKELLGEFGFNKVKIKDPNRCYWFYNDEYGKDFHINVYLSILDQKFVEVVEWVDELDWEKDFTAFDCTYCNLPEYISLSFIENELTLLVRYVDTCK